MIPYDINKDYFAILEIPPHAEQALIKRAYRKMARRYHPDVSTLLNSKEKFQDVAEAYEVLSKHKEAYWQAFFTAKQPVASNSTGSSSPPRNATSRTQERSMQRGFRGKDRRITYSLTLRHAIRLLRLGYFYISGLKLRMKFNRDALVGKTFRLAGKGYSGLFGGKPGDFFVRFELKLNGSRWQLRGEDLYGRVPVPEILLSPGQYLELDSPAGTIKLKVPEDYSPDTYIRVANMGLPADEMHAAGDLYAKLVVL